MLTLYAACLRHLGLSQESAGVVHARYGTPVRPDTIKSWASGRRQAPPGVFDDLARFAAHARTTVNPPADVGQALYLEEHISPSVADDAGFPSPDAMMVAVAAAMLRGDG